MLVFRTLLEVAVAGASLTCIGLGLRDLLRRPVTLTVTRLETGKTVVLDTRADWREGRKLGALLVDGKAVGQEREAG